MREAGQGFAWQVRGVVWTLKPGHFTAFFRCPGNDVEAGCGRNLIRNKNPVKQSEKSFQNIAKKSRIRGQ